MQAGHPGLLHLYPPPHKSLYHAAPGVGLPIGSLTSQFFANIYLNELDQFVKHTLKVRGYLRYVDDFVLLADAPQTLMAYQKRIAIFLQERLQFRLHPRKTVLQRSNQGIDYLDTIVYPHHRLMRQRSVRSLRRRIAWFKHLVFGACEQAVSPPPVGHWSRWLQNHQAFLAPQTPTSALLQKKLATLNSYYGLFGHADTYRLRQHIYHHELGPLKRFFLPDGPSCRHLQIKAVWKTVDE